MPRADVRREPQERNETRQRILAAAGQLFAEHGFAGTSVRMIARQLNITDPAVHYHFPTKQSIYDALLDQPEYGPLPLDSVAPSREGLIEQVMHLFAWWASRPEMGRMLLREQLASHEPSLQFMADGDETWKLAVATPLVGLYGQRGESFAATLYMVMCGLYWDAILSYGAQAGPVLEQAYFRERMRAIVERLLPPVEQGDEHD